MWDRRRLLAVLTTTSAAAGSIRLAEAQSAGTTAPPMPGMPSMAPGMMTAQDCVESCWRSSAMCLTTERHCLERGGMHAAPTHLALLADCAAMCQTTANSLLRRSSQHAAICVACAQVCDACAQECEGFRDDERMLLCARTCRDCAKHCREMSRIPI